MKRSILVMVLLCASAGLGWAGTPARTYVRQSTPQPLVLNEGRTAIALCDRVTDAAVGGGLVPTPPLPADHLAVQNSESCRDRASCGGALEVDGWVVTAGLLVASPPGINPSFIAYVLCIEP
jgi:hypothetical protein